MSKLYVEISTTSDDGEITEKPVKYLLHIPGKSTFPLMPSALSLFRQLQSNGFVKCEEKAEMKKEYGPGTKYCWKCGKRMRWPNKEPRKLDTCDVCGARDLCKVKE